eukprot:GHVT01078444.1.p1 GENE.GHVT01078444.1~~GHVT01078444.1.p1  ORF type:complete len:468 (+),score=97.67 GHVT01078444.1:192-1595(+)
MMMGAPRGQVLIFRQDLKREVGRKAQTANIQAAKAMSEIVRTTLGPRSMLKMLLDPMGGIVITNDGNAILREVDVAHPAAKSMIELSRSQDEEVGDGTTSVVVIAGELLVAAEPLLVKLRLHPTIVVAGYMAALDDALAIMKKCATVLSPEDDQQLAATVDTCLGTKFASRWGGLICRLAVKAAKCVTVTSSNGTEIDIKRYVKVEKLAGGELEESCVLEGVLLNKDITHPKMRRLIQSPKILLLDCPLEYKKNESATEMEVTNETDWGAMLEQEEKEIATMAASIIATGANVVITEKGVSDLMQHFLLKAGISCIRRVRKTDNNRIARICGATICNRTEELTQDDVGTKCKLFRVQKIGDDYYTYLVECDSPKACSVILRGSSKDVLNEIERNFHDALSVARNLILEPTLLPGGGAIEMELAARLLEKARGRKEGKKWKKGEQERSAPIAAQGKIPQCRHLPSPSC